MPHPKDEWNDHFGKKYTSSQSQDWRTPQWLFNALDAEFQFDLDAAATLDNRRCKRYLGPDHATPAQRDALKASWAPAIRNMLWTVFLNPPYGRDIESWYERAYDQSRRRGVTVVMLVNANTETTYWEKYAHKAAEIRFISGRVGYDHPETGKSTGHMQTKGSALVIFRWLSEGPPTYVTVKRADLQKKGAVVEAARLANKPLHERTDAEFAEARRSRRSAPPPPTKKITKRKPPPAPVRK